MRILVLNWRDLAHPSAGGAERYVHEIARRWSFRGHDVVQLGARAPGTAPVEEVDGVRILRRGGRLTVYREATTLMREGSWDAVVESVNTRPFFAHRAVPGTPTLALFHQLARDVWFHETPLPVAVAGRYVLEPRWLRRYRGTRVAAVSPSTARDLQGLGIRPVAIAPPGTPVPPVGLPQREEAPTLAFLGRLNRSKRPDAAVEAWRIVRRSVPEARMWVLGDGPMRASLPGAEDGLTVFGRVDEPRKWELLARADLLLVPSVREGWGIVVMEAAAVGTPSVGYRVPGLVDTIRHDRTGWVCDPDPASMAAAAVDALASRSVSGVRAAATEHARAFTWDAAADTLLHAALESEEVRV